MSSFHLSRNKTKEQMLIKLILSKARLLWLAPLFVMVSVGVGPLPQPSNEAHAFNSGWLPSIDLKAVARGDAVTFSRQDNPYVLYQYRDYPEGTAVPDRTYAAVGDTWISRTGDADILRGPTEGGIRLLPLPDFPDGDDGRPDEAEISRNQEFNGDDGLAVLVLGDEQRDSSTTQFVSSIGDMGQQTRSGHDTGRHEHHLGLRWCSGRNATHSWCLPACGPPDEGSRWETLTLEHPPITVRMTELYPDAVIVCRVQAGTHNFERGMSDAAGAGANGPQAMVRGHGR